MPRFCPHSSQGMQDASAHQERCSVTQSGQLPEVIEAFVFIPASQSGKCLSTVRRYTYINCCFLKLYLTYLTSSSLEGELV